jgi:hypothetical protein
MGSPDFPVDEAQIVGLFMESVFYGYVYFLNVPPDHGLMQCCSPLEFLWKFASV